MLFFCRFVGSSFFLDRGSHTFFAYNIFLNVAQKHSTPFLVLAVLQGAAFKVYEIIDRSPAMDTQVLHPLNRTPITLVFQLSQQFFFGFGLERWLASGLHM